MKRSVLVGVLILCLLFALLPAGALAVRAVPAPVLDAVNSVVRIRAESEEYISTGSGFVVYSERDATYIATNFHVVEDDPYDIAVWVNSTETVQAEIAAGSPEKDLCILKLQYPILTLKPLPLHTEKAAQGDAVYAVGFPGAADHLSTEDAHDSSEATVTDGIISALRTVSVSEYGAAVSLYQVNAAINSGNSGGPLFNEKGQVIGINTYSVYDSQGIFGSIAVSELVAFMKDHAIPVPEAEKGSVVLLLALGTAALLGIAAAAAACIVQRKKRKVSPLSKLAAERQLPFNRGEAIAALMPLAFVLRDMHRSGQCHLEISPDTVVIGADGTAKLLPPTGNEINRYRQGYAAPEIYAGRPEGPRSDVYSFTAVLYHMVTLAEPENALSRANSEDDDALYGSVEPKDPFAAVLERGMDPAPLERIQDMQQLIAALMPFMEQQNPSGSKAKERRKMGILAWILPAGMLLIACIGIYTGCYIKAVALMGGMQAHEAERYVFTPAAKIHDRNLPAYIEAGKLFEDRRFEEAGTAFAKLGDYRDSANLVLESHYCAALKDLDASRFEAARERFEMLAEAGYRDSAAKVKETRYREGAYLLYVEGDYALAYDTFSTLSHNGYAKAEDMAVEAAVYWVDALISQGEYEAAYDLIHDCGADAATVDELTDYIAPFLYEEALYAYEGYDIEKASELFHMISWYEDSESYIWILEGLCFMIGEGDEGNLPIIVKKLAEIIYMEDAAFALVCDQEVAKQFLSGGVWSSEDGSCFLEMEKDGSIRYDLPGDVEDDYYYISGGEFYSYSEGETWYDEGEVLYEITPIDVDCLALYVCREGMSVYLYRES